MAAPQLIPKHEGMKTRVNAMDWSQTAIGVQETWPVALRMQVDFLLANRFPMVLFWGPNFISIYNDAYQPMLGDKHPKALGQPVREVWSEVWETLEPLLSGPYLGGPAAWVEDLELELRRSEAAIEEAHFAVAYSPVPDATAPNGIGGVIAVVHEISQSIISERRASILHELSSQAVKGKSPEAVCQGMAETVGRHAKDVPFALLYLLDTDGRRAQLCGAAGIDQADAFAPDVIALEGAIAPDGSWPLIEALSRKDQVVVPELAKRFTAVPAGPWSDPPHTAVVVPIRSSQDSEIAGLLVVGVSARLALDERYQMFVEQMALQIAWALTEIRLHDEERRRADRALRHSEERLELAAEAANIGTFIWYPLEDRSDADARMMAHFGLTPDSTLTLAEALARLIVPEDRAGYAEAVAAAIDPNGSGELRKDIRVARSDGSTRWLAISAHVSFEGEPPQPVRMNGTAIDITERKNTEEALRRSEARLRLAVEANRMVAWEWDPVLDRITTSQNFQDVYGLPVLSGIAEGMALVWPADLPAHAAKVARLRQHGGEYLSEYRITRPDDGRTIWLEERASALTDAEGNVTRLVGVVTDITEQKRHEAALRDSEERFRLIFESIDEGFAMVEVLFDAEDRPSDYRFLQVNPYFDQLTGLNDVVGKTARGLVEGLEDAWIATIGRVALSGESLSFESGPDSLGRWFEIHAARIGDVSSRRVALVFSNTTERKQIEQERTRYAQELETRVNERTVELQESNRALEKSQGELRQLWAYLQQVREEERAWMAREIHDELGQQLTGLRMALTSLQKKTALQDDAPQMQIRQIIDGVSDTIQTVRRLATELRPAVLDELGFVEALEWQLRELERNTGIQGALVTKLEHWALDRELRTGLFRVLQEALTNVARHAKATRVAVHLEHRADQLILQVQDNGRGIDEQSTASATSLGLLGMRERVRLLGGDMTIIGEAGKGTTVAVSIPLGDRPQAPAHMPD